MLYKCKYAKIYENRATEINISYFKNHSPRNITYRAGLLSLQSQMNLFHSITELSCDLSWKKMNIDDIGHWTFSFKVNLFHFFLPFFVTFTQTQLLLEIGLLVAMNISHIASTNEITPHQKQKNMQTWNMENRINSAFQYNKTYSRNNLKKRKAQGT